MKYKNLVFALFYKHNKFHEKWINIHVATANIEICARLITHPVYMRDNVI